MKFKVTLVEDAEIDLFEIYIYVARNDFVQNADRLLDSLEGTILKLGYLPSRGHIPPELERIGVLEFREVYFKPYRIIYQIRRSEVLAHCVLDGRRDLKELLEERLLRF